MHYTSKQYHQMDQTLFSDCSERKVFFKLLKEYGGTLAPEIQNSFKVGVDIGSVSGFYLAAFQGLGMKAIGINPDPKAIQYVREEAVMRNFLFASDDFLDARNAFISAQKINRCLFSCVVFVLPCKARAHSVQKASGYAGNVDVGTFVYLGRDYNNFYWT